MDLTNIALWTISLTLATIGITFGIVASINSSRANNKVQNLISNTFITEKSEKLLFDNLKQIITNNRKVIKAIDKNLSYSDYALMASDTRLHVLSRGAIEALKQTEFNDLTHKYIETKSILDSKFTSIIGDLNKLRTENKIPAKSCKELIEYHESVIKYSTTLVKAYTEIVFHTNEINIKK